MKRFLSSLVDAGSSPRGRGKHARVCTPRCRQRLIPAWAGKTRFHPVDAHGIPAHPRVGGENSLAEVRRRTSRGSSPRGRGKHKTDRVRSHSSGLIPAWAGKTGLRAQAGTAQPAHPRVGGENH